MLAAAIRRHVFSSARAITFTRGMAIAPAAESRIKSLVKEPIAVFMKGQPGAPQCGFSGAVDSVLKLHGINEYSFINVLDDIDIREGIKEFSNWPTIPQVYIGGEFIGGADIIIEMHTNGELSKLLPKSTKAASPDATNI